MGQAWDKELSAEHSKLFSDWCSELREIRRMSINRLFFKNLYKIETTQFHRRVRRSDVHSGISARRGSVETDLCNREMSWGSNHTHGNTEVRTPGRSLRSSSQKADTQRK